MAFTLSFLPRYWLHTTAPPAARAAKSWIRRLFRASTSPTAETASSPTPDTMSVSTKPMATERSCSIRSGHIRIRRSFLEKSSNFFTAFFIKYTLGPRKTASRGPITRYTSIALSINTSPDRELQVQVWVL